MKFQLFPNNLPQSHWKYDHFEGLSVAFFKRPVGSEMGSECSFFHELRCFPYDKRLKINCLDNLTTTVWKFNYSPPRFRKRIGNWTIFRVISKEICTMTPFDLKVFWKAFFLVVKGILSIYGSIFRLIPLELHHKAGWKSFYWTNCIGPP